MYTPYVVKSSVSARDYRGPADVGVVEMIIVTGVVGLFQGLLNFIALLLSPILGIFGIAF